MPSYKEFKKPRYAPRDCGGANSAMKDFADAPAHDEPNPEGLSLIDDRRGSGDVSPVRKRPPKNIPLLVELAVMIAPTLKWKRFSVCSAHF